MIRTMTELAEIENTCSIEKNKNCYRKYRAGRLNVCLSFLWKNKNWNIIWDKITYVVPYMVVVK